MGLFSPERRNEFLKILKGELNRYEELRSRKKSRVRKVLEIIISFIKHIIWLVENYYRQDFKTSNSAEIFQKDVGKLDIHINSIIHRGRDCKLNSSKILNFWKGKNIGHINAKKMSEKDVANFIYSIRRLLGYLYKELEKI